MERTPLSADESDKSIDLKGEVDLDLKDELAKEQERRKVLEDKLDNLREVVSLEKEKARDLQSQLVENHKKIRMLNTGAESLDKILCAGQPPKKNWGLGYSGGVLIDRPTTQAGPIPGFVYGGTSVSELSKECAGKSSVSEPSKECAEKPQVIEKSVTRESKEETMCLKQETKVKPISGGRKKRACFFCHKTGHIKRRCFKLKKIIKRAWSQRQCYPEPKHFGKVWIDRRRSKKRNHTTIGKEVPAEFTHKATGKSINIPLAPGGEGTFSASSRFKACLLLLPIKRRRFFEIDCRLRSKGDVTTEFRRSVRISYDLPPLSEHLFIFRGGEVGVGTSEITFEFSCANNDDKIIGCGVQILTEEASSREVDYFDTESSSRGEVDYYTKTRSTDNDYFANLLQVLFSSKQNVQVDWRQILVQFQTKMYKWTGVKYSIRWRHIPVINYYFLQGLNFG
ncbi:hypothetical protein EUTSA_v10027763mg [Eutrema salsugineum]|uniref:CCHC-type domain-containing protein n=1 Tax=Eutrema salsugineum TaxID=72664 RepID=V4LW94_EUTSA|nr:hypothetical protein EUTSA_v10027763mg [Eutrema salsugineum]